jgi:transcriptional regulator with XRE-family HTH domain
MDEFKTNLKMLRRQHHLTQEQLGKMLNTGKSKISKYESGYNIPPFDVFCDITTVFSASADYLLGRREDNEIFDIPADTNSLKANLKRLRKEKGLRQRQLAENIGVFRSRIFDYENGHLLPPVSVLCKMADFFSVSVDFLLGRQPPNNT